MATIVQPYDPWREKLAASILGPLVGNMIQKGQEAEQNRKRNAMLAAWTDANAVQEPLTGQWISTLPDIFSKNDFTLGFDKDLRPWASSLVDNGALPQMDMSMAAPAQPQAPTLTSLFQLGGTKRFGGVNMDTVMPFAKELMAEQEAQRQRTAAAQRQAEMGQFLEGMRNIEGWDPYMRAMSEYVLRGYGGADALKEMSDYALGRQPKHEFKNFNTNETMYGIDFDPATGQGRQMFSAPMGISQYQAGELALGQDRNALGWAKYNTNPKESPGISETDRWKAAIDMKKSQIEGIRKQREEILKSLNLVPGEDVPPDIATQISHLNAQEAALMEEYNTLVNGTQGGQGLSQDEGYNALPDEWKQKADEWRKRGYDIQVHWYGENQCQIFAIDPRNRDSTTQINPKQENIKRVKTPAANDGVLFPGDTAGVASGDVRPQGQTPAAQSVTRAEYDAMCAKYGKEAVDAEMKRNGVPIP